MPGSGACEPNTVDTSVGGQGPWNFQTPVTRTQSRLINTVGKVRKPFVARESGQKREREREREREAHLRREMNHRLEKVGCAHGHLRTSSLSITVGDAFGLSLVHINITL
jgi:hypothetical protein